MMPWQMDPTQVVLVLTPQLPLRRVPSGGFPVPESLAPSQLPPAVRASIRRLMEGPPKPAVTLNVMNQTQATMIAPDLPWKANV